MKYQPILGLEIHVELKTNSKMFCSCRNDPNERHPNMLICPICLGHPGTLPVINREAVRKVIKTGISLNCQIPEYSEFDRKNYFYPDLPKGYQISQYDAPLCLGGYLQIPSFNDNSDAKKLQITNYKLQTNSKFKLQNSKKKIRIRRIHLEEDTGRLIHEKDYSLVDFNRAGIPLMELVTEPDIGSAKEARRFAEELQLILRYLDVSDADMEKGQFRVEANISLISTNLPQISRMKNKKISDIRGQIRANSRRLGTKVEIKNLNSFRAVEKGIDYEIERQTKILNSGKKVVQETRGWDENREETIGQREKEEAHDYRYFPEPDLPPLHITPEMITEIKAEIPELPQQKRERFVKEYQLDGKNIEVFVFNKDLGEYFEKAMSELRQWIKEIEIKQRVAEDEFFKLSRLCSNYVITDLQGLLKGALVTGEPRTKTFGLVRGMDFLITPENFAEFIALIYEGKISSKLAKVVLAEMFSTGADPSNIIEKEGLAQITDEAAIEKIIKEVISKNEKAVLDYKRGKENAFQFLIGQVMSQTKGKANPEVVNEILKRFLS